MEEAIGYVRQSTLKQQSLATQKSLIMDTAKQYGWSNVTFYDDKKTGRHTKRSGYQRMVEAIRSGKCKVLCCYRLNRLHRNLKNALKLMKLCQKYHVHILSVHDGYFDMDKAFDRLKLNIFISLAELESDNIGEQVKNGLKEKARQGKLITTHAPFGYTYHNGTFTINQDEAPTVKAIFHYYLQGYGYKKIAQYLETDDQYIKRKPYQVRAIIMNPNYCSRVINQYGQYDNMFPPIISISSYEQAQILRSEKHVKRTPSANQLKQKIKCPCCGATLTNMTIRRKQHNTLRYYVCPRNMNESRFVCDFKGINAKDIETSVLKTCQHFFQDQQVYSKINDAIQQHIQKQNTLETKRTYTQAQLINKLAKGTIDAETFKTEIQNLHQQNTLTSINSKRIQSAFHNVIQKRFTLNMLYPFIDVIHITKNKELSGIYLKDEPLNIVNQAVQSSIA
ncbi:MULTISPECIES: recombinase family protein [unclassified Staphylococcus]|uniref:cassette chromosome recombinase CcrA n=1 Tax=unclassified Staphylococcus TaxID=91994 RepID=UPI00194FFE99|nr:MULTISPECIES: recombinase family protein [unclassified Staphylococcus]